MVKSINEGDTCELVDVVELTADPEIKSIENKQYREIFMMFHKTIMDNGVVAVRDINDVYEFNVQLDNSRPLKIDKSSQEVFVDYIDFTIDLRNDRGKLYVGNYENHIKKINKADMAKQYKPVTTF